MMPLSQSSSTRFPVGVTEAGSHQDGLLSPLPLLKGQRFLAGYAAGVICNNVSDGGGEATTSTDEVAVAPVTPSSRLVAPHTAAPAPAPAPEPLPESSCVGYFKQL